MVIVEIIRKTIKNEGCVFLYTQRRFNAECVWSFQISSHEWHIPRPSLSGSSAAGSLSDSRSRGGSASSQGSSSNHSTHVRRPSKSCVTTITHKVSASIIPTRNTLYIDDANLIFYAPKVFQPLRHVIKVKRITKK